MSYECMKPSPVSWLLCVEVLLLVFPFLFNHTMPQECLAFTHKEVSWSIHPECDSLTRISESTHGHCSVWRLLHLVSYRQCRNRRHNKKEPQAAAPFPHAACVQPPHENTALTPCVTPCIRSESYRGAHWWVTHQRRWCELVQRCHWYQPVCKERATFAVSLLLDARFRELDVNTDTRKICWWTMNWFSSFPTWCNP